MSQHGHDGFYTGGKNIQSHDLQRTKKHRYCKQIVYMYVQALCYISQEMPIKYKGLTGVIRVQSMCKCKWVMICIQEASFRV